MNSIKTTYNKLPETISIPKEFIHKQGEIIIILADEHISQKKLLKDFYGSLPDFPIRSNQGNYEERDPL